METEIKRDEKGRFVKGGNSYLYGGFKKGNETWNIGLTKEIDERLKKASINQSISRRKGLEDGKIKIWNKGLTKEDKRVNTCIVKRKKWIEENIKGKTYEEIYGKEKAEEIKRIQGIKSSLAKQGEKNSMFGKSHTKEWAEQHSETMKRLYDEGKMKIEYRRGENHPNWNNGSSFEPYDSNFTKLFRNKIRKRDNQICMNCGIHREKLKETLSIHHINYDKKLTIPQNCISLCRKCHGLIQFNRKHWIKFFQSLLAEKYDYQYSETGDIVLNLIKSKKLKHG